MISRPVLVCMAVAIAGPAAAAEAPAPIERLFFTPAQRESLDVARSQRTRTTLSTEERTEPVVEQPVPQTITYGGMVRRSDGRTTVWINDRPVDDQEAAGGATVIRRVGPDGAVTLEVPQSKRRVDLKVGQSVEVLSGSVGDGYRQPKKAAEDERPAGSANADTPAKPETRKAPSAIEPEGQGSQASERAAVQEGGAATAGSR